jgi:hypothetical protein
VVYDLFWEDDAVISAEVHECEEAEKTIIISVKVTILIRLVLRIPETVDELMADLMVTKK